MNVSLDVIYCDDIRTETSGKIIAIGVYTDGIVIGIPDQPVFLSVWVRFFGLIEGSHKNTLSFTLNDDVLFSASGNIISDGKAVPQAHLQNVGFMFEEEGTLQSSVEFDDGTIVHGPPIEISFREHQPDDIKVE